ncbi:unannotated protein [freshwater metagenome]|uniref:Unannotated protein n=1 Tax=freshwater metagenome TaxID=449393 RepID=A0A6J6YDA5_9ZZZZ
METAWSLDERKLKAERSAPAAKMNGLPVIAMTSGFKEIASEIALFKLAREAGPKVFGRLWS